ncbi:MAG TPA: carboxypeptidase-like regulatory domain-containing protein, partial [Polyangia bacterium]
MLKTPLFVVVLASLSLAVLRPGTALAQGGTSGTLAGYVFDEGGMPLKGVKVTATSPTQIGGQKNAYTSDEGAFRIPHLAPGTFEVRASAPKLETIVNKGVKVGITSVTELNIVMKVQTKTEVVAVVEKAPLVKTTKANITETFELETVEA